MLHVTRCCTNDGVDQEGLRARFGHLEINEQLTTLAKRLEASADHPVEVTLVDDVIFSGGGIELIYRLGLPFSLVVKRVIAGIVIRSECGKRLESLGIGYDAVRVFPEPGTSTPIIDEICERDFFVFAPMTGRTLADPKRDAGFPYVYPFGNAAKWASFGTMAKIVSQRLIELNMDLLTEIEQTVGQPVRFDHLVREPMGVRTAHIATDRLLDHLQWHLLRYR